MRLYRMAAVAVAAAMAPAVAYAQGAPPLATVTAIVERDRVAAGSTVRVALRVELLDGLHVQSNKPRDPSLIPTVLTVEPSDGVTVAETVYPRATDLVQAGQKVPLAVFGQQFLIGLQLRLAADLAAGEVSVPARLRYQACDETVCYVPQTARVTWTFRVTPSGESSPARHPEVFERIEFASDRRR